MKEITMIFGRINPPTKGHEVMINFARDYARKNNTDLALFPSQKSDNKKNPLDIKIKIKFLKKFFKFIPIVVTPNLKTPFNIIDDLIDRKKYEKINFIVGGDRKDDFTQALKKYYKEKVNVINSGKRIDGISATDLREAVLNNNFDIFELGLPSTVEEDDAKQLYMEVQKGLNGSKRKVNK